MDIIELNYVIWIAHYSGVLTCGNIFAIAFFLNLVRNPAVFAGNSSRLARGEVNALRDRNFFDLGGVNL